MNQVLATHSPGTSSGGLSPQLQQKAAAAQATLARAVAEYGSVVYSNSLGAEAIVLTDIIWSRSLEIGIFTIDTGRLPDETYSLLDRLQRRYARQIQVYYPEAARLESLVARNGINGFYNGVEERLSCCHIRKVEPFRRAIAGHKAWVTGVRREQSAARSHAQSNEWDDSHGLYKVSPLLDWSEEDVWEYIRALKLPYNALHDRGYRSIGCVPCTRAVEPGQDSRSGRWWWENPESRECGLHPRIRVAVQSSARPA
jgi:phosphoadenosine phosphosulfate reductase